METFRTKEINDGIDKKDFVGFENEWKSKENSNRLKKFKKLITNNFLVIINSAGRTKFTLHI